MSVSAGPITLFSDNLDEASLAAVHDLYYPQVYRFALFRLDDPTAAEDVAGEAFLRLVDTLNQPGKTIRNLRSWLLGTAAHIAADYLRGLYRKPSRPFSGLEQVPASENTSGEVEMNEQQRLVFAALENLTADQSQVIYLRFMLECSVQETARIMSKSQGAIKLLQFRAIAALRKQLDSHANDPR